MHAAVHAIAMLLAAAQPELRPIDAGTEDVSVNSQSRLLPRFEQRVPSEFNQVYVMTKPDGERVFIRMAGGIYAEFKRSVYSTTGLPMIPPGTIFRQGSPTDAEAPPPEPAPAHNRVSFAADTGRASAPDASATRDSNASIAVGEPSICGNELYRRVRISQLLFGLLKPGASEP